LRNLIVLVLSVGLLAASTFAADSYKVTKKLPIPNQGGWDYLKVDEAARRLYVSHGTRVDVLDVDSGEILGNIPTLGVHGIALAPEFGRGFISDGKAAKVLIFDLKTMKVIQEVAAGKNPDAIIYDPASSRVFAFNGGSNSATAINAADGTIAGTVDLGGGPEFAVADGEGFVLTITSRTKAWS
jgi:DNA-binding beta-propeller fold protein YncE